MKSIRNHIQEALHLRDADILNKGLLKDMKNVNPGSVVVTDGVDDSGWWEYCIKIDGDQEALDKNSNVFKKEYDASVNDYLRKLIIDRSIYTDGMPSTDELLDEFMESEDGNIVFSFPFYGDQMEVPNDCSAVGTAAAFRAMFAMNDSINGSNDLQKVKSICDKYISGVKKKQYIDD